MNVLNAVSVKEQAARVGSTLKNGGLLDASQKEFLINFLKNVDVPHYKYPSYEVNVNYDLPLEEAVKANGKVRNYSGDEISSVNFPSEEMGKAKLIIYLVSYDFKIKTKAVLEDLDTQGLRPVTIRELLALGAKYPDLHCNFPIVALGSKWKPNLEVSLVPYLFGGQMERVLNRVLWNNEFRENWCFAAVEKK